MKSNAHLLMLRIYLDKQIISYMRSLPPGKELIYGKLLDMLRSQPDEFMLPYSIGHFSDLIRDLTDKKDDDLRFMKDIGLRYFMRFDPVKKENFIVKAIPLEAFYKGKFSRTSSYKEKKDLAEYEDLFKMGKHLYSRYYNILCKIDANPKNIKKLHPNDVALYEKLKNIIPFSKRDISQRKFMKYWHAYFNKMSKKPRKELDLHISNLLKSTKAVYSLPPYRLDFSKSNLKYDLHNSSLQNFFIEGVLELMHTQDEDNLNKLDTAYYFFNFYQLLERTGMVSEKSSKFSVHSLASDGIHAFNASYCDVLITEDKKLSQKAKLLYGLLYINTLVFTTEEFLDYFDVYKKTVITDREQVTGLAKLETKRYLQNIKREFGSFGEAHDIDSEWRYLGFFNNIFYQQKDNNTFELVLSRITNNYANNWTIEEIERVVNTSIAVFGLDIYKYSLFNYNNEIADIQHNRWRGRSWSYNDSQIRLLINNLDMRHVFLVITQLTPFT